MTKLSQNWQEYIKITSDLEREKEFQKITSNRSFQSVVRFLNFVLFDDPNPLLRIKAAEIILANQREKFVPILAEIAQTDSMLEGYIGLISLLKPFIEKHNLPYNGVKTSPWVFDQLRKIYINDEYEKIK